MPAKLLGFLAYCCLFLCKSYGQTSASTHTFIREKFRPYILHLTPEKRDAVAAAGSTFKEFEVVDYRPDTARIGFSFDRTFGHRQLILKPSVTHAVASFLNEGFGNASASNSLLVVIRKLWLSEIVPEEPEHAFTGKPHNNAISFRAETYLKDGDTYLPFGYFDTIITAAKLPLQVTPFRLPVLLNAMMRKLVLLDTDKALTTRRRVSYAFIDSFSNRKFLNVMNKADTLQKGVYSNLDDFKNNCPKIKDYEIQEDGGTLAIYLKDEQGKPYFTRKIWGYCDGQTSYAMINGHLYPVLRENNAFYVFGAKDYELQTKKPSSFLLYPSTVAYTIAVPVSQKAIMKLRMYTLDPETGEIE